MLTSLPHLLDEVVGELEIINSGVDAVCSEVSGVYYAVGGE